MNAKQRDKIKQRQRGAVAQALAGDGVDPAQVAPAPAAPRRPIEEVIAERRPRRPDGEPWAPGVPVARVWFKDKTINIPGHNSGDDLKAGTKSTGKEHRIEWIAEERAILVCFIDAQRGEVKYRVLHETLPASWEPA